MTFILISILIVLGLVFIASVTEFIKNKIANKNTIPSILLGMVCILLTAVIIPETVSNIKEIIKTKTEETPDNQHDQMKTIPDANELEQIPVAYGLYAPVDIFIFPYSSERRLTVEDLDSKFLKMNSYDQAYYSQLAIDEIFFRHGWAFYDYGENLDDFQRKMLEQFNQYEWFIEAKTHYPQGMTWQNYMHDRMNKIENSNVELLANWQNEHIPPISS